MAFTGGKGVTIRRATFRAELEHAMKTAPGVLNHVLFNGPVGLHFSYKITQLGGLDTKFSVARTFADVKPGEYFTDHTHKSGYRICQTFDGKNAIVNTTGPHWAMVNVSDDHVVEPR